jgi:hypothetical protein
MTANAVVRRSRAHASSWATSAAAVWKSFHGVPGPLVALDRDQALAAVERLADAGEPHAPLARSVALDVLEDVVYVHLAGDLLAHDGPSRGSWMCPDRTG